MSGFLLLATATSAVVMRAPAPTPLLHATHASAAAPQMLLNRPPPEIMRIAQPDWRYKESSCSPAEVISIWRAFEGVYGSREKALAASRKNQQVILPYINTPENIKGAYKALGA